MTRAIATWWGLGREIVLRYDSLAMITDIRAYERLSERERCEELRRMSPQQSIAVGEALLRKSALPKVERLAAIRRFE